ncbi:uncharacterized protein L203_106153 [Cryptococcus depauperatus CBS 7841]|uniref:Myb/SANT-like domain-containing protein n=1 Tax=Cryptococcus depauperatus CBS 7841 TaxID=1295531 RepID=A0AAJ8JYL8_9TREE
MVSNSSDLANEDCKRLAHWSDKDTSIHISILMRETDSGRTSDNDLKPKVWKEIPSLLDGSNFMGSRKTPEACKSIWQRLQRDYKLANELEMMPRFSWDSKTHQLPASEGTWVATDMQYEGVQERRKINLPCPSAASSAGSSQILQKSLRASQDNTEQADYDATGHGVFDWEGQQNGDDDFESFDMSNDSLSFLPQKRIMSFDPPLISTSSSSAQYPLSMSKGSPNKRQHTGNPSHQTMTYEFLDSQNSSQPYIYPLSNLTF